MAKVYRGAQAFYNEFDVSGEANEYTPSFDLEIKESRKFSSNYVHKDPGIQNDSATLAGQMAFEDPGTSFFNNIGSKVPFSIALAGATAAEGDHCHLMQALSGSLSGPVEHGELYKFNLSLPCDSPIVIGYCLGNGNKTATGNTASGVSAGAVAAGESIYASLHVPTATSGTVDVTIESAATGDPSFASPTTRLTFTQVTTTATAEWKSAVSAAGITDTLWRAVWTGASTPDHTLFVAFGIGRP